VEILSPGTRRHDLDTKRALYARFSVLALASDKFEPVPSGETGAITSRVLPGLTLALKDVFAGFER